MNALRNRIKSLILQDLGNRVSKIILFGSQATGLATVNSDYDLMVVLKKLN